MVNRRLRGGGFFSTTTISPGGMSVKTIHWWNIFYFILGLVVLGTIIGVAVYFGTRKKQDDSGPEHRSGGSTMNKVPGSIKIAEVSQAPSAGQAIIYFSQQQAPGASCDNCTSTFDINMTYYGGKPNPSPVFKKVTGSSTSGTVTFDYSIPSQTGTPMPLAPTPPTQVNVKITAREVDPATGKMGGPTSFSKTIPYVAA